MIPPQTLQMQIFALGALAGAAKTYNAICAAVTGVRGSKKYIFCVPSTDLVEQIEKDRRSVGFQAVTAIHSRDGFGGSVVAASVIIFGPLTRTAAKF